ncbi:regulatory protein RecX [Sinomonas humi]|uniref:Regulatory protein RecX n=1 Tax=Sinomonas humi TaxID=1338436 RepID=A0A0B2AB09_9MICC|nr:regulatory protein RecX [Sinomonas humi]KHL00792.1 RecX family transcriptional regulator [Sinomonas humi]
MTGTAPEEDREADPESVARAILLRQLTLGPRSKHQLAIKLRDRRVPEDVAVALLDRFEDIGLIDDTAFAEMWVRSRFATKGLSKSALRRELASKGIDGPVAEAALSELDDDEELSAARALVERRRRPFDTGDLTARDRELRRLVGMLARKGHPPGRAFRVVSEVLDAENNP